MSDSEHRIIKIPYSRDDRLVHRFAGRLLRREIFEKLAEDGFQSQVVPEAKLVMFGSGAVQYHRPKGGYPISRQARDLDLGFVLPVSFHNIPSVLQEEFNTRIKAIAMDIGATVEEKIDEEKKPYLHITKIYQPEVLLERTEGKIEHPLVDNDTGVEVELDIPMAVQRTPLLPIKPLGDKGFHKENILDVLAGKMARMVRPKSGFVLRDVIDFYNLIATGVVDPQRDGPVLRALTIAHLAAYNYGENSFAALKPNDENIDAMCKLRNLGTEDRETMRKVYEKVYQDIRTIFPRERSTLPDSQAGELGFTMRELDFMLSVRGFRYLPGGRGTEPVVPDIYPSAIVGDELEAQYPGLRAAIRTNDRLVEGVAHAREFRNQIEY